VGTRYGDFVEELKSIKIVVPNLKDENKKFLLNRKKDEAISIMTTYISRELSFHSSGIDYSNEVWSKMMKLFNKVDESEIIQIEKELISLEPLSFGGIEDYFSRVKEL